MKTATKVILAISIAMIVLGSGISIMAWAVSGGDIGVTWNPRYGNITRTHNGYGSSSGRMEAGSTEPGAFQSLSLNTDYGMVKLIQSDRYFVEYKLLADLPPVEISNRDGNLVIRNTPGNIENGISLMGGFPWGKNLDNLGEKAYIYVYYPKGTTFTDVTLVNSLGKVDAEGLSVSGTLDVSADLGAVELSEVTAKKVIVEADMGAVELDGVKADKLEAELAMGGLSAANCVLKGVQANADMGGIELKGDITGDVDLSCAMGGIVFKTSAPRADYFLDVSTGMGGVQVNDERFHDNSVNSVSAPYRLTLSCDMGGADLYFGR